jgi:hypothetical protein
MLLLLSNVSISGIASQTDWSGGDGIPGPVTDWSDMFYSASGIVFGNTLTLSTYNFIEHLVTGDSSAIRTYPVDLDGDGDIDIIEIKSPGTIQWWANLDGQGTEWASFPISSYGLSGPACSSDFDGDGDIDIVAGVSGNDVVWWDQFDTGSDLLWTMHTIDTYFDAPSSFCSEDIDDDGDMDIVGASAGDMEDIVWWENLDGSGLFWEQHVLLEESNYEATSVAVADLNGDGNPDIAGASDWGEVDCWINLDGSGTAWQEYLVADKAGGKVDIDLKDVDGDGDIDIVAVMAENDVMWFENADGSGGSWVEHYIDQNFPGDSFVTSADFDSDGYLDVFASGESTGFNLWTGDGGTSWDKHVIAVVPVQGYPMSVGSADINGDGNTELLASCAGTEHYIKWWSVSPSESEGSLISSILDVEESPDWQLIDWTSTGATGTSVSFQVRSSDDPQSMGPWSDTLLVPCNLTEYLTEGERYFQYMAILATSDPDETPVLQDVSVAWLPSQGIGDSESDCPIISLKGAFPNPSSDRASIYFELSECCLAELFVYDLSGRIVYASQRVYEPGEHLIQLDDLNSGLYLIRMNAGDHTITRPFALIE